MKAYLALGFLLVTGSICLGQNQTIQTPITMEQLMRELRIQGGNFEFKFDKPAFAKVTATTMEYPEGKRTTEEFVTAKANRKIQLFFTASAMFVGDYPRGDVFGNQKKMLIKLSGCEATDGTRVVAYVDKFTENKYSGNGMTVLCDAALPDVPEFGKEYILHWYYKEGDPYEAKATIIFSDKPFSP
jgi:hypothetical protein